MVNTHRTGVGSAQVKRALIFTVIGAALLVNKSDWPFGGTITTRAQDFSAALNPATHDIDFGYYNMDGRNSPTQGLQSYQSEVWHYTNLYIGDICGYVIDTYGCPATAQFEASLQRAYNAGKDIYLLTSPSLLNQILDAATPFWSRVKYIEVAHEEGNLTSAQLEDRIIATEASLSSHVPALATRPIGITLSFADAIAGRGGMSAPSLDFVNVTAYVNPPGSGNSQENIDRLNSDLDATLQAIPASKNVFWWMMAFDRNGEWTNISTLKDLQAPVYEKSYNNPRVVGIIMFAYARPGGTRAHPELKIEHRRIAEKLYFRNPLCLLACDGEIDGDHRGDLTVYRPSNGMWYHLHSASEFTVSSSYQWGLPDDIPVDGDFDGDGKMDLTVYRPSTGEWYIRYSRGAGTSPIQWGLPGDIPVAADFDGDGKSDLTVYRPSSGNWYIQYSSGPGNSPDQNSPYQWGLSTDVPIAGDFDGDGRSEISVYRPASGEWYIRYSTKAYAAYQGNWYFQWGLGSENDQPIIADFDRDGKTDITVFRPNTGEWFIRYSSLGYAAYTGDWYFQWGLSGDKPMSMDLDGDGKTELIVYRPSSSYWYIRYSSLGYAVNTGNYSIQWGLPGDTPLPNPIR